MASLLFGLSSGLTIAFSIALLLVLLVCSALISGSEVAYFSLTPKELHDLRADGSPGSNRIIHLRTIPRKMLATILIANNFVNIAIVLVSNYISLTVLPEETYHGWAGRLQSLGLFSMFTTDGISRGINFVITTVMVTFLLVLFGEVAPKIYAKMNNVRLAKFMSSPLLVMIRLFSPLSSLLVNWSVRIEDRLRRSGGAAHTDKDDIDKAIDLAMTHSEGASSQIEADILKGIIKFNDVAVKQIMRARVDVVAVDQTVDYNALLEVVKASGYSRIPVFEDDFDNVIGMLYVKDLISHRHEKQGFHWQKLIRPEVLYVPESKKINDLLKSFQDAHKHMAIVVDEYGGSAGLVTLEDVMEEVIGEITDEFDFAREEDYKQIDEQTFVFDGKVLINDACRIMHLDASVLDNVRGDADSLAGLILEISGEMPNKGEEYEIKGLHFIILSVTSRRIEKVRIKILENGS